jgi:thiol-disulfide isomerase/thioredoxin
LKKLFPALVFTLFSTLTVGPAFVSVAAAQEQISSAPLFAATLNDLDDNPVALERYKGKPLVVNFWARWCGPCRAEIPELIKFRAAHKGKIEILGIGIEDKAEPAKEFAKAYEMDYPVFIAKDKGIPLMQALGNTKGGLPYTLFLDRNGKVVKVKLGQVKHNDLNGMAEALLKP